MSRKLKKTKKQKQKQQQQQQQKTNKQNIIKIKSPAIKSTQPALNCSKLTIGILD